MNFNKRVNGSWTNIPHYIHNTSTDTITTLPAVLYPNAVTATVGLKGNMEQSGTPTPSSPIQPSECGERTKNLFDKDNVDITHIYPLLNGTTFTQGGDKSWSIIMPCKPNTTYTLSKSILSHSKPRHRVSGSEEYPTAGGAQTFIDDKSETISGDTRSQQIFTTTENTHWIVCFLYFDNSYESLIDQLQSLQLEEGNDKTAYEPYGYKLPISSAGQTNNIYLGEVESTRQIKKLVLDGTENWAIDTTNNIFFYVNHLVDNVRHINGFCTHFRYFVVTSSNTSNGVCVTSNGAVRLRYSEYNTVDDFKSFLAAQYAAGTPVCVWYVLATPTTGIVNEPIRKIGDYADSVSGITIPTIAGANSFDVLTTLKPSEVTVNYKGWHPVADVHERENGQWD